MPKTERGVSGACYSATHSRMRSLEPYVSDCFETAPVIRRKTSRRVRISAEALASQQHDACSRRVMMTGDGSHPCASVRYAIAVGLIAISKGLSDSMVQASFGIPCELPPPSTAEADEQGVFHSF